MANAVREKSWMRGNWHRTSCHLHTVLQPQPLLALVVFLIPTSPMFAIQSLPFPPVPKPYPQYQLSNGQLLNTGFITFMMMCAQG